MAFDIEGARKAGYSDTEIADHLATENKFDAAGARKSGYGDAEIISHLSPMSWGDAVGKGIKAVPDSALNLGKNLATAALNPIDTTEGLVRIGAGAMESAFPGNSGLPSGNVEKYEAFKQALAERYGSMDALKNTVATDPVGLFADVAGLAAGGGGLMSKAGTMARMPQLARAGASVARAGNIVDPVNMARQAATVPIRMLPSEALPRRWWNSAIKPNKSQFPTAADQEMLFNTALENNIQLTNGGQAKLRGLMSGVGENINNIIDTGNAAGDTVDAFSVANRVDELRPYYQNQVIPSHFTGKLDDVQVGFVAEHPTNIPVSTAQQMKKDIYHENRKKYGETRTVSDEAEKAIARGLKEEIENLYPEMKGLNERYSKFIDLDGAIDDALMRIGKHQMLGFTAPMYGAAGGQAAGIGGGVGAVVGKLLADSQPLKAKIALSLAAAKRYPDFGTKGSAKRAIATNAATDLDANE